MGDFEIMLQFDSTFFKYDGEGKQFFCLCDNK